MENFKKQFENELKNLEIEDTDVLSEKHIATKFKKKALKVHSDKTGNDDEEFKDLLNDYHKVLNAFKELKLDAQDEEKDDLQTFFEKHNLAKEFSQSWTVFVEKKLVPMWLSELKSRYIQIKEFFKEMDHNSKI